MDAQTFKEIFIPYHAKLFRIAYRLVANTSIAEDILQETYIKLWNKRENLNNIDNTEAFAVVILKNSCLDHIKQLKTQLHNDYDTQLADSNSLTNNVEAKDEVEIIVRLMETLPDQQREVMKLKHWEHKTDEEIEKITGLKAGNIRVMISRARKTIREKLIKLK